MKNIASTSKELDTAIWRTIFGAVPVVGSVLNEVVFDIRGRVKQERLNKFTQMFSEYFIGSPDFDTEILKTEDFGDLLEAVIKRVVQTKSEEKYRRYKQVLVGQIENRFSGSSNSERYLELISSLDEIEIFILSCHKVFDGNYIRENENLRLLKQKNEMLVTELKKEIKNSYEGLANNKIKVKYDLDIVKEKIKFIESSFEDFSIYRESSFYKITINQFNYHKQNLYSKALLVDLGIGTYGYIPFANMGITEFGNDFLQFLTDDIKF